MAPKKDPPLTLSVPDAGRKYFNIGRNASYRAAEAGQIPVIRIGGLLTRASDPTGTHA
jgi:hypothetical protein